MEAINIFSGPLGQRLTWTLLHFLWQGAVLAGLLDTAVYLFGVRAMATRYRMTLAALMLMAACPAVTFWLVRPEPVAADVPRPAAVEQIAPPYLPRVNVPIVVGPPETSAVERVGCVERSQSNPVRCARTSTASRNAPVSSSVLHAPYTSSMLAHWQPYLLSGWAIGASLFGLRLLIGGGMAWRMRCGRQPLDQTWTGRARRLAARMGLARARVFVSARVRQALVTGIWRPMVLLPAAWLAEMPPEMLEGVLAHELAHLRRLDLWAVLLQRLVETLLFYHPAVWWLSRRLSRQREMCCDEMAVAASGDRLAFTKALQWAVGQPAAGVGPVLGAAWKGSRKMVLERIRRLLGAENSRERFSWWPLGLAALVVPLVLMLSATGSLRQSAATAEEPPAVAACQNAAAKPDKLSPRPAQPVVPQVLFEVTMLELDRTKIRDSGFDLSRLGIGAAQRVGNRLQWGLNRKTVEQLTAALRKDNMARSLAEPNITTLSGRCASFSCGGEVPQHLLASETKSPQPWDYRYKFAFLPKAMSNGKLHLECRVEVSEMDEPPVKLQNARIAGMQTNTIEFVVEMNSGETLALSGMRISSSGLGLANDNGKTASGKDPTQPKATQDEREFLLLVVPQLVSVTPAQESLISVNRAPQARAPAITPPAPAPVLPPDYRAAKPRVAIPGGSTFGVGVNSDAGLVGKVTIDAQDFGAKNGRPRPSISGGTPALAERPLFHDLIVIGNDTFKSSLLKKEAGIKTGDAADPVAVENGRQKIEKYYRDHGLSKVRVTVLEGTKPGDLRVVYLVDEGTQQRVCWIDFVGNTFVSAARLRTIIDAHPRSSSRTGECDPKRVDEDVEKLIAFYRGFGFFHATIGREVKFDEKQNCATLTFVVNEGPRYTIRNITFVGNRKLENARLAKQLKMLSGQYFDGNQQSLDLQKLRDEYGAAGYVLAKIKAESRFLEEPGKLDIVYHIEEGGRYRISRLNIETKGDNPAVYVIVASKDKGDHVAKVLANPSSTVASAILQVEGAAASAAKETVWLARPKRNSATNASKTEVKQIDWAAIVQRGSVEANLRLLPGDRIFIGQRPPEGGAGSGGGNTEFQARESVIAEGATFIARCARLSYSQANDQLIFEGDGQSDAELYMQGQEGGAVQPFKAQKITYSKKTGQVHVDGFRSLEANQSPEKSAPAGYR